MKSLRRLGAALLIALALTVAATGCRMAARGDDGGEAAIRTELFFGLARPDGNTVSTAEWQSFLDTVVTPRFRQGLTVVDGHGQWLNREGTVCQEPCRIVILLYPPSLANRDAIEAIRREYRQRFQQESVLRVTSPAGVSF